MSGPVIRIYVILYIEIKKGETFYGKKINTERSEGSAVRFF